jgi:hypothetical protein
MVCIAAFERGAARVEMARLMGKITRERRALG